MWRLICVFVELKPFVAYNVQISSGAFKIRANKTWNDAKNYGLKDHRAYVSKIKVTYE